MSPHGLALTSPDNEALLRSLHACVRANPELSGLVKFRVAKDEIWIVKTTFALEE